jgi:hypothetical protein
LTYFDKDEPEFSFRLPGDIPDMSIDIGEGKVHMKPSLHTVYVDMEKKLLSMLWRGSVEIESFEALGTIGAPKIVIQ